MPMPATHHIETYEGDTLSMAFSFFDSEGLPIDLSTAAVKMQVRKRPGAPVKLELSEGDGITVSGGDDNIATVTATIALLPDTYAYDLQATFGSAVRTYVAGNFKVLPQITI